MHNGFNRTGMNFYQQQGVGINRYQQQVYTTPQSNLGRSVWQGVAAAQAQQRQVAQQQLQVQQQQQQQRRAQQMNFSNTRQNATPSTNAKRDSGNDSLQRNQQNSGTQNKLNTSSASADNKDPKNNKGSQKQAESSNAQQTGSNVRSGSSQRTPITAPAKNDSPAPSRPVLLRPGSEKQRQEIKAPVTSRNGGQEKKSLDTLSSTDAAVSKTQSVMNTDSNKDSAKSTSMKQGTSMQSTDQQRKIPGLMDGNKGSNAKDRFEGNRTQHQAQSAENNKTSVGAKIDNSDESKNSFFNKNAGFSNKLAHRLGARTSVSGSNTDAASKEPDNIAAGNHEQKDQMTTKGEAESAANSGNMNEGYGYQGQNRQGKRFNQKYGQGNRGNQSTGRYQNQGQEKDTKFKQGSQNMSGPPNERDWKQQADNRREGQRRGGGYNQDRFWERMQELSGPQYDLEPLDMSEKKFNAQSRLFVGSLGRDVDLEELKEMFSKYGELGQVYFNKEGGYAFINFDFHGNAEKALRSLNGVTMKGRTMKVRFAAITTGVKVRNLAPTVTNELLHKAFSVFGNVETSRVSVDDRGKPTGDGIVVFTEKRAAVMAFKKCQEHSYFITSQLRPVIVEPWETTDDDEGFPEASIQKNDSYQRDRKVGPRFAEPNSAESDYAKHWKQLFDIYKEKKQSLENDLKAEMEALEVKMQLVAHQQETEKLRKELAQREQEARQLEMGLGMYSETYRPSTQLTSGDDAFGAPPPPVAGMKRSHDYYEQGQGAAGDSRAGGGQYERSNYYDSYYRGGGYDDRQGAGYEQQPPPRGGGNAPYGGGSYYDNPPPSGRAEGEVARVADPSGTAVVAASPGSDVRGAALSTSVAPTVAAPFDVGQQQGSYDASADAYDGRPSAVSSEAPYGRSGSAQGAYDSSAGGAQYDLPVKRQRY